MHNLLHHLVDGNVRVLRSDLDRILFIVPGHVAGSARGRIAVFIEADGDVDFAGERRNSRVPQLRGRLPCGSVETLLWLPAQTLLGSRDRLCCVRQQAQSSVH